MRIALVAPDAAPPEPPAAAPRGQRVTSLARAMARQGHDVTVYASKNAAELPGRVRVDQRVTIEHVPAGPPARAPADDWAPHVRAFGDHLARRWETDPPDIAHAHMWTSGLAALAGARGLGFPVVQTFHSLGGEGRRARPRPPREPQARARLRISLARNVSAVLASSSEEKADLAGLGVPRARITVVPCGVDTARFSPEGPAAKRGTRGRLLAVGPPTEQQGLDVVIRALAEVPETELVLAGARDAPASVAHIARGLAHLAEELGVSRRVVFAGEPGPADLPSLLRSADLLVSAAWDAPSGVVALQAMACGTPVVASAVGGYTDAVVDGTTGVLVPPGEPAELARRVRQLLASPLQRQAFGIAAADRARARYSWDRISAETVHAYERCLSVA